MSLSSIVMLEFQEGDLVIVLANMMFGLLQLIANPICFRIRRTEFLVSIKIQMTIVSLQVFSLLCSLRMVIRLTSTLRMVKAKRLFLVLLTVLFFQNGEAQTSATSPKECEKKNVTLKSEWKSRNRYFFFRRTNFVKTKRFDRVIDAKGKVVKEIIMRSETRGDESLFHKFHRLIIVENEIHEVIYRMNKKEGEVIIYNFCGDKLKEMDLETNEFFDKYGF